MTAFNVSGAQHLGGAVEWVAEELVIDCIEQEQWAEIAQRGD